MTDETTPPAQPTPEQTGEQSPATPTPTPAPGPPAVPGKHAPPRPGGPRPGGASRQFPQGDKPFPRSEQPQNPGGAPPQLRDFAAHKPNNRELDAMIEDELNQAMAGFSIENEVAKTETQQKPQAAGTTPGQRKKGRIVGIHGKDVFVEVPGGRSQGVLPLQQFEGRTPTIGEEVEFDIERYDGANGLLVLTREGSAQVVTDWSSVALHMIVEARVTGTNKNKTGLTVEVNGIKGFLPASQLDLYRVEDIDQFLNQRIKVQVVELDPEERNLIVSRRALLERERRSEGRAILDDDLRRASPQGHRQEHQAVRGVRRSRRRRRTHPGLRILVAARQRPERVREGRAGSPGDGFARRFRRAEDRVEHQATHDEPVRRVRDASEGRRAPLRQGHADRGLRRIRGTRAGRSRA